MVLVLNNQRNKQRNYYDGAKSWFADELSVCGQSFPVHVENVIQHFVKVGRQDRFTDVSGGFVVVFFSSGHYRMESLEWETNIAFLC